jgi:predicted outer membrane repeat protein
MAHASHIRLARYRQLITRNIAAIVLVLSFLFPGRAAAFPPLIVSIFAKPGGLSSGNCWDWSVACELQYALSQTSPSAGYDNYVYVEEGTYSPGPSRSDSFVLRNYTHIYGGFSSADHNNRNPALYPSVLSGDVNGNDSGCTSGNRGENNYHVVDSGGVDNTAALDGFYIMRGNADNLFGSGGGLYITSGNPGFANLVFSCNTASMGGAVYNGGTAQFMNVTFDHNSAADGGAYIGGSSLANAIFAGNNGQYGGAIRVVGNLTLTNVTFSHNIAEFNGGAINVPSGSSAVLKNVILWGDTGGTGSEVYNQPDAPAGTSSIDHSVVQGGCPTDSTCTNLVTTDPMLGSLLYNGGSNRTIALGPGSSAIDAGDDTACGLAPVSGYDQRGILRPQGPHCDSGSYEVEYASISGNADVVGVTISLSSGGSTGTDASGDYTIGVPIHWAGTVTPSKTGYIFMPPNRSYSDVASNLINQDFTADPLAAPMIAHLYPADLSTVCVRPIVGVDLLLSNMVRNGAGSFAPSTVTLKLDGIDRTSAAVIAESESFPAARATILYTPPSNLGAGSHEVKFLYPSPSGMLTQTWHFTASGSTCTLSAEVTAPVTTSLDAPLVLESAVVTDLTSDTSAPTATPVLTPYQRLRLRR